MCFSCDVARADNTLTIVVSSCAAAVLLIGIIAAFQFIRLTVENFSSHRRHYYFRRQFQGFLAAYNIT